MWWVDVTDMVEATPVAGDATRLEARRRRQWRRCNVGGGDDAGEGYGRGAR